MYVEKIGHIKKKKKCHQKPKNKERITKLTENIVSDRITKRKT